MSPALQPLRRLAQEVRTHGSVLLADMADPHDELMSLVWGPRFDREHALGLLARQPQAAIHALPVLLAAADQFDALHAHAQGRLRALIVRHRALCVAVPSSVATLDAGGQDGARIDHAPNPAH